MSGAGTIPAVARARLRRRILATSGLSSVPVFRHTVLGRDLLFGPQRIVRPAVELQCQDRNVVGLLGLSLEGSDGGHRMIHRRLHIFCALGSQQIFQPVFGKEVIFCVYRFGDTVGVEEQKITLLQGVPLLLVARNIGERQHGDGGFISIFGRLIFGVRRPNICCLQCNHDLLNQVRFVPIFRC